MLRQKKENKKEENKPDPRLALAHEVAHLFTICTDTAAFFGAEMCVCVCVCVFIRAHARARI
jgi:DNA-binding XRE family transcriptional regulator